MEGYIDIHTHILPAVDDGAADQAMACQMLELAYADGIRGMILTPHYKNGYRGRSAQEIEEQFKQFSDIVCKQHSDMQLYLGTEAYCEIELPEKLERGEIWPMAGSRYVLVEFRPSAAYSKITSCTNALIQYGYCPILAHIERYECLRKSQERIEELRKMGALIQINAGSVMGKVGFGTKLFCGRLLKQNQVHFIATDAHNADTRQPVLRECAQYVARKYGSLAANALFRENARKLLLNEDI